MSADTTSLIRQMAQDNRLWGAERIRGELLKLGIRVSKRTTQRYIATKRKGRPTGQKWTTFICSHTCKYSRDAEPSFRSYGKRNGVRTSPHAVSTVAFYGRIGVRTAVSVWSL